METMLDQALETSGHDKHDESPDEHAQLVQPEVIGEEQAAAIASVTNQGTITLDPSVQYQFRADTGQGQVTYRVVQVAQDGSDGQPQVVTTNAFSAGGQVAQAVIQSPFNGESPTAEGLGGAETRFTYVPAVTATADGANTQTDVAAGTATIGQVATAGGQFYVMMSPQEVLQGQRTIAPRTTAISPRIEGTRSGRDERRRATHNEVERRRRDKINSWIVQLSKLVPDCSQEVSKQGQIGSKGGILAKACEYIEGLRSANARMAESLKEMEKLSVDVELLRQQCEELKQENSVLRAQLQQHGIVMDLTGTSS